ncbi:MAG: hypothetical protein JWP37_4261 [Mucilaginibacter sp.]|nr:hypothetical protein [Mucilaginibacter sp.]
MKKIFYSLLLLSVILASSCTKEKKVVPKPITDTTKLTPTALDLIKDSVFLFAKEDYLWYDQLPTYQVFNPRSFTDPDDMTALTKEVDALSQIAINPTTTKPYEYYVPNPGEAKYSFIDDGSVSAELNGVKGDFGFAPFYNHLDESDLRVKYVYPGSPADLKGIKRGYRITSINSRTSLTYDGDNGPNVNFVVNAYAYSNTISMTLLKPDGTTLTVNNMSTANYNVNPVLKDSVYNPSKGRKVGYMVFNSFTSQDNAGPQLDLVFNKFIDSAITDLVVDLRYNGGGYVSTAEYIDNYIVPATKSGTPMYITYYNNNLQNDIHPLLSGVYNIPAGSFKPENSDNSISFNKKGSLNVNHVYFIITGATASASELTINNLRPEMDVQFVGNTSYGKPVGFFAIDINKYQLYIPEFYTQNSAGQGGYYSGFTPGASTSAYPGVEDFDDVTKDFGDSGEGLLAHILSYVKTGTYSVKSPVIQSLSSRQTMSISAENSLAKKMSKSKFNGMIFDKKLKSKKRF